MKKSAQDIEIEKLKKQVEKLKKAKESLQRDKRNLKGRLSTAQSKNAKYRSALKKRETECWIGQGDIRMHDESIGRHHYSSLMVALSVAFYARLSVGSRQIVEIFNILNEFMGNVFGKVPAYTTIGYWTQELGLSVYKESCSLFKDKRYALMVDESMMIGSEKLLLTLAIPAINAGSAITEEDVTIVDISIAKSWNGTSIKNVLEKVADKIGHKPEYVISDNGYTVCKAVRDAGYAHHLDISHTLGIFLERVYKKEADFQELSNNVQLVRFKYNMQDIAYLQPPSQRSIARFMNMSKWIDWISRMQYLYHTLRDDIKSIYAFIPHNASLVDELAETMDCITKIEKDVKNNGWSHDTISRCKQLVTTSLMSENERQCKVGSFILEYVER
ncbi:hypothetical protein [Prevotella sp.]|uniref:hypothetical protein n=1 Tax=Prevotella sp. TaxID=59823 RepID=UPI0025D8B926|nr:hypothetical protein [Prevotella sp.]